MINCIAKISAVVKRGGTGNTDKAIDEEVFFWKTWQEWAFSWWL